MNYNISLLESNYHNEIMFYIYICYDKFIRIRKISLKIKYLRIIYIPHFYSIIFRWKGDKINRSFNLDEINRRQFDDKKKKEKNRLIHV